MTRYSLTRFSCFHSRLTVLSVTLVTVSSVGGDTGNGGEKKKSQTEVIRSSQVSGNNDLPSFTFSQEQFLRLISHAGNEEGMSHRLAAEERNAQLMETTDISRSHGPISALTLAHNLWLTVFQLLLSWLRHKTAIAGSRGIQMLIQLPAARDCRAISHAICTDFPK